MKKISKVFAICLVAALFVSLTACGNTSGGSTDGGDSGTENDVYNLVFTTHAAPTTTYAKAIDEWVVDMKEKSNGRLNIDVYYGGTIAAAPDSVDVVGQGGADFCWTTVPLNNSKFQYCNVFACYGDEITNSMAPTYALIKLLENNPDIANEYDRLNLKPIAVHAMTPNNLGSADIKFEKAEDFNGVSIMAISSANIAMLTKLKAAVIGVVIGDLYENFSKNVSKAALMDALLYDSTSCYEHIDYLCTHNLNTCIAFIAMNKDTYNSLPADLQELIDSSFYDLSYTCAEYVNTGWKEFVKKIEDLGVECYDMSDELIATFDELMKEEVYEPWVEICKSNGVDYATIESQIEQYLAEGNEKYGDDYDWFN